MACKALRFFRDEHIRRLGIEKLQKTNLPSIYLYLLVANYRTGDHTLLSEVVNGCQDTDEIHALAYGLLDIYRANQTKECRPDLSRVSGC